MRQSRPGLPHARFYGDFGDSAGKNGRSPEKICRSPRIFCRSTCCLGRVPGLLGPVLRAWRAATGDAVSYERLNKLMSVVRRTVILSLGGAGVLSGSGAGISRRGLELHAEAETGRKGVGRFTFGHKKRDTAVSQPFVNLKSNTMKNTVQRYDVLVNRQAVPEEM